MFARQSIFVERHANEINFRQRGIVHVFYREELIESWKMEDGYCIIYVDTYLLFQNCLILLIE